MTFGGNQGKDNSKEINFLLLNFLYVLFAKTEGPESKPAFKRNEFSILLPPKKGPLLPKKTYTNDVAK